MYRIYPLCPGFSGALSTGSLGWSAVFALVSPERTLLVDTGGPNVRRTLQPSLRKLGIDPKCVTDILFTHLHWDHIYNLDLFPDATVWVHQAELDAAAHGDPMAYHPALLTLLGGHPVHILKAQTETVFPGIRSLLTPGHTQGSVSYLVETPQGTSAMCADAVKNRAELRGSVRQTGDLAQSLDSIELLKQNAQLFYPGHDAPFTADGTALAAEPLILRAAPGMQIDGKKEITLVLQEEENV